MSSLQTRERPTSEELAERIVSCLPAATFEMETLCRLAAIEATDSISSAAVTCEGRPRLLINPDFVEAHCARDEHLFLLVMHELYHVLLAHTRLYPRVTETQNIAFDAVINAGLARQFPGPEYRGFFERLNAADAFPARLLRPPEGWPDSPVYSGAGPRGTRSVIERLYPKDGRGDVEMPTYDEILSLFESEGLARLQSGLSREATDGRPVLIGNHEPADAEREALRDPLLADAVRRIVSRWPPPPIRLRGRNEGGDVESWLQALGPCPERAQRAFSVVLRRALTYPDGRIARRERRLERLPAGRGVLPTPDRLVPAKRLLGLPATLYEQSMPQPVRVPDPSQAHVYLDVSGSMAQLLPHLLALLLRPAAAGLMRVFQFSTAVEELPLARLRERVLGTSYGTGIDPVIEHLLGQPRARRAVLLTDGYTGAPRDALARELERRRVRVDVVLPAESAYEGDLRGIAASFTTLPPLFSTRGGAW